jgi:hypothetical protein
MNLPFLYFIKADVVRWVKLPESSQAKPSAAPAAKDKQPTTKKSTAKQPRGK